jgi:hypothetical protein
MTCSLDQDLTEKSASRERKTKRRQLNLERDQRTMGSNWTQWQRAATGLDTGTRKRETRSRGKHRLGQGRRNPGGKTLRGEPKAGRGEQTPCMPLAQARETN